MATVATASRQASRFTSSTDRVAQHLVSLIRTIALGALWLQLWLVAMAVAIWAVTDWTPMVITGESMAPHLPLGHVVYMDDVDIGDIRPGDVVAFDVDDHVVTHRVVDVSADGSVRTKGDANPSVDSTPVTAENLRGRARVVVPFAGLLRVWTSTHDVRNLVTWFVANGLLGGLGAWTVTRSRRAAGSALPPPTQATPVVHPPQSVTMLSDQANPRTTPVLPGRLDLPCPWAPPVGPAVTVAPGPPLLVGAAS